MGIALKDNGRLDEAIAAHRRTIALNPHIAEAYYNLANELREAGQLDDRPWRLSAGRRDQAQTSCNPLQSWRYPARPRAA